MSQEFDLLRKLAFEGLEIRKLSSQDKAIRRLEYELETADKLGFTPYFLIVSDICEAARQRDVLVGPGRGSGVASLLNYCLRITNLNPLEYNLIFERFLSVDRLSPPDIDMDFSDRDTVIEYIIERYGEERTTRVGTLGFLRTKSAIKDIGRVLEIDQSLINELSELVPPPVAGLWESIEAEIEVQPLLNDPKYEPIMSLVKKLWGITRSYGTHAGGVAIAPGPVYEYVPLYRGKKGITSQFDWRDLEKSGLLKLDILGLETLSVIKLCLDGLKQEGIILDIYSLDENDELAYDLIRNGNLDGIFQLGGSQSIKQLTQSIGPKNLGELALVSALFRPGTLSSGLAMKVANIRQGKESPNYLFPELEPILGETSGVITYQEQLMRVATDICGYTPHMSYLLMKLVGKKKKDLMKEEEQKFVSGAVSMGHQEEKAKQLWKQVQDYGQYIFNAGHAIGYASITYWTAYLKAHYPVHFYAALLAREGDPDMIPQYVSSAREDGIRILPPDINKSGVYHKPEGNSIRYGLCHIQGMPFAAAEEIVKVRDGI
jgi:DNA polymerase-3 subunit alpha